MSEYLTQVDIENKLSSLQTMIKLHYEDFEKDEAFLKVLRVRWMVYVYLLNHPEEMEKVDCDVFSEMGKKDYILLFNKAKRFEAKMEKWQQKEKAVKAKLNPAFPVTPPDYTMAVTDENLVNYAQQIQEQQAQRLAKILNLTSIENDEDYEEEEDEDDVEDAEDSDYDSDDEDDTESEDEDCDDEDDDAEEEYLDDIEESEDDEEDTEDEVDAEYDEAACDDDFDNDLEAEEIDGDDIEEVDYAKEEVVVPSRLKEPRKILKRKQPDEFNQSQVDNSSEFVDDDYDDFEDDSVNEVLYNKK